jgi:hypothetical protein
MSNIIANIIIANIIANKNKFPEHHQSTAPLVPPILRPHYLTMFWRQCLLWAILCYSQSGDHPQEDLAKFGCKLNVREFFIKKILYIFWLSP